MPKVEHDQSKYRLLDIAIWQETVARDSILQRMRSIYLSIVIGHWSFVFRANDQ